VTCVMRPTRPEPFLVVFAAAAAFAMLRFLLVS
jgi:hypothetical protein